MFTGKQVHAAVGDARFDQTVQALASAVETPVTNDDRVLALATLCRLATVSKASRSKVEPVIHRAVVTPLPSLRTLTDPDDRGYVADACRFADPTWAVPFLARAALEEVGEKNKARDKMLVVLLEKSGAVVEVLSQLLDALRSWEPGTEAPADSAVRRLRLLTLSLAAAISSVPCLMTPPAGTVLARMSEAAARFSDKRATPKVVTLLADAVLAFTHELIRHRFLLATEPALYDPLPVLRAAMGKATWQRYLNDSQALRTITKDITQAITLLATQGRSDDTLYQRLLDVAGSDEAARRIARGIASSEPGIPPSIHAWLSGTVAPSETSAELTGFATRQRAFDEANDLALLFRDAARLSSMAEQAQKDLLPDVALIAPRQGSRLEILLAQSLAVADAVGGFASRRRLGLVGEPGTTEEFSSERHALDRTGIRRVRIVQPAVEVVAENGIRSIILRAVVEPSGE